MTYRLVAIDLETGARKWEAVLGTTRDQAPFPLWFATGAPNLGGTLATGGGLVFIGATTDKYFRAFDAETGRELWRYRTPYTANASPVTYRQRPDGKQYVAILSGVGGWAGAVVVANLDPRDPTAALGFAGAMKDLPEHTTKGGTLYVFSLP